VPIDQIILGLPCHAPAVEFGPKRASVAAMDSTDSAIHCGRQLQQSNAGKTAQSFFATLKVRIGDTLKSWRQRLSRTAPPLQYENCCARRALVLRTVRSIHAAKFEVKLHMPPAGIAVLHKAYDRGYKEAFDQKHAQLLSEPSYRTAPTAAIYWIAHRAAEKTIPLGRHDDAKIARHYLKCMKNVSHEANDMLAQSLGQERALLETWAELDSAWQILQTMSEATLQSPRTFEKVAEICTHAIEVRYAAKFKAANISTEDFSDATAEVCACLPGEHQSNILAGYRVNPFPAQVTALSEMMDEKLANFDAADSLAVANASMMETIAAHPKAFQQALEFAPGNFSAELAHATFAPEYSANFLASFKRFGVSDDGQRPPLQTRLYIAHNEAIGMTLSRHPELKEARKMFEQLLAVRCDTGRFKTAAQDWIRSHVQ
jgi:hypothetical protein